MTFSPTFLHGPDDDEDPGDPSEEEPCDCLHTRGAR